MNSPASFAPPFDERPPWFGRDLQTLRNALRGGPAELPGGARLLLPMTDGDRLAARLDLPAQPTRRPLVVLIHGLTGSEASHAVVGTARHLVGQGWPTLRLNLRGSPMSRPTSAGRYHAGRTDDLAEALRQIPGDYARRDFILLGHSLGGNLVLKFMGERRHGLAIRAAAVVSTPLDLAATCKMMMAPRNFVYHRHMLAAMKGEALAEGAAITSRERAAVAGARSVYEFDDLFVARHFGYRDAPDYYESNSAAGFLNCVDRPTLIVHAFDDPWIPQNCYDSVDWSNLPMIETAFASRGGHLGFHGRDSLIPWHDRVVTQWLSGLFPPWDEQPDETR